jgi:hypothetical protein
MSKRSSRSKRRRRALPALGFAGVSLSMASGACASTNEAMANTPPTSQSQNHEIFLADEEISDVSLATFYVFDKENAGPPPLAQQLRLAAHGGCGCGCHGGGGGCGGCRGAAGIGCGGHPGGAWGCGRPGGMVCASAVRPGIGVVHPAGAWGCHAGFGGRCRCGGFFFRRGFGCGCGGCGWGCGGCGGTCWIWTPTWGWVYTCWSQSTPPAEVSSVVSEQSTQTTEVVGKGDGNIDRRTK